MERSAAIASGVAAAVVIVVATVGRFAGVAPLELRPPVPARAARGEAIDAVAHDVECAAVADVGTPPIEALRVALPSVSPPQEVAPPKEPPITHRVRVVAAADRSPIAGALVLAMVGDVPRVEWRTDAAGVATPLVDREDELVVKAPGWCCEPIGIVGIDVAPPPPGGEIVVELRPACALSGVVVDADGAPVARAFVAAIGDFRRERLRVERGCVIQALHEIARTDANGRFGPVVGSAGGSVWFRVVAGDRVAALPGVSFAVVPGSSIEVELRLPRPVELVVELLAADGGQAELHDLVLVAERRFDLFAPPSVGAHFRPRSSTRLELEAAGTYHVEVRKGVKDSEVVLASDVVVGPGTTTLRWRLPAKRRVAWSGGHRASDRAAACGTIRGSVACRCPPDAPCRTLRVDLRRGGVVHFSADRKCPYAFEFEKLQPGSYELLVGGGEHRRLAPLPVELLPGAIVEIGELVVDRQPRRHGRIVDQEGRPLDSIAFALVDTLVHPRDVYLGASDASGRFSAPRFDGPCTIVVRDAAIGFHRFDAPVDPSVEWIVAVATPRRITGRLLLPESVAPDTVRVAVRNGVDPDLEESLRRWVAEAPPVEGAIGRDGRFEIACATARACVVELQCEALSWRAPIAVREVPAGGDFDLGRWELKMPR